jgi:hypothetical protein
MLRQIVSGGQTGVDRAALDAARTLGLRCGGWCPRGRRADDGRIAGHYPLRETPSTRYIQRTEWNVRDSDATLIVARGALSGGTLKTLETARRLNKPVYVLDLNRGIGDNAFPDWRKQNGVGVLNVAGPRESQRHGIYAEALDVLVVLFRPLVKEVELRQCLTQR